MQGHTSSRQVTHYYGKVNPHRLCFFCCLGPTGPDGRLSNFGHFHNCTFVGNVAREYGAAMGAITLLYFQDMVDLLPLEIDSWLVHQHLLLG